MNLNRISLLEEIAQRADRTAQERKKHPERFTASGDRITEPDGMPANKATGQAKPGQVKKHTAHKDKQPQRTDNQPQRKHKDINALLSKAETLLH
jgi:hypothetical protein